MSRFLKYSLLALMTCCSWAWAATSTSNNTATSSTSTSNYKVLASSSLPANITVPPGKILVFDFFSYGCPHCARLSPYLEKWLAANATNIVSTEKPKTTSPKTTNPKPLPPYIIFQAVPVSFESGWDLYSKTFYIAQLLHVEHTLHDKIFDIAQNPLLGLNSDAQIRSFFLNNGVTAADYDQVANSQQLTQAMTAGQQLLKSFKIMEIPTVIVMNGTTAYYISNSTVQKADPDTFIAALTQLTARPKATAK